MIGPFVIAIVASLGIGVVISLVISKISSEAVDE